MRSLRSMLLKYFYVLCIIPILGIGIFKFFFLKDYYYEIFLKQDRIIALSTKALTENLLKKQEVSIKNLLSTHNDCSVCSSTCNILNTFSENSDFIDNILFLDKKGIVRNIGGDQQFREKEKDFLGMDFSGIDSFKKCKETNRSSYSKQFYSIISGRLSLSYCMPAENGFILAIFRIDNFYKDLVDVFSDDDLGFIITDESGRIIQKFEKTLSFNDLSISHIVSGLKKNNTSEGGIFTLDGKKRIGVLQKIEKPQWNLIIFSDYEDYSGFLLKIRIAIILVLITLIFIVYIISSKLSKRIVAPIEKASMYADNMLKKTSDTELLNAEYEEFQGFIEKIKRLKERVEEREYALKKLSLELSSNDEKDIFKKLSRMIADILECDHSIIGQVKGNTVDVLDMYSEGNHIEDFVYDLKDTPCGEVIKTGFCVYSGGVQDVFPDDIDLQKLNAQAYIGLPVFNKKNQTVGIINALSKSRRRFNRFDRDILTIVASKVSSILEIREKTKEEKTRINLFDRVINFMPAGLVVFNEKNFIKKINVQAKEALRIKSKEVFHLDDLGFLHEEISNVLTRIKRDSVYEESISGNKDGKEYYFSISGYKVRISGDQFLIVKIRDVSDNVRINNLIVHDEKMSSLSSVGAGMAHELNNPISGILQSAQNIKKRVDSENQKNAKLAKEIGIDLERLNEYLQKRGILNFLENIENAGAKAADIVEYLKEFATEEADSFREENLNRIIKNSINILKTDYKLKKEYRLDDFEFSIGSDNDISFVCIPVQLELVFYNIMKNSVQFFDENNKKTPLITINSRVVDDRVFISIKDNGKGMDENTKSRMFNPFFTTRPDFKGIGLTSSYFVIKEKHKGDIEVISDPGKGTEIVLTLPIKQR